MKTIGLLLVSSVVAFAQEPVVSILSKSYVSAHGKWIPADEHTDKKSFESVTDISCSKTFMRREGDEPIGECTENSAQLWGGTYLKTNLNRYEIVMWSNNAITANHEDPCMIDWLVIEFGPKRVTLLNVPRGVWISPLSGHPGDSGELCVDFLYKMERYRLVAAEPQKPRKDNK
jgi:hypothetical protein